MSNRLSYKTLSEIIGNLYNQYVVLEYDYELAVSMTVLSVQFFTTPTLISIGPYIYFLCFFPWYWKLFCICEYDPFITFMNLLICCMWILVLFIYFINLFVNGYRCITRFLVASLRFSVLTTYDLWKKTVAFLFFFFSFNVMSWLVQHLF